MGVLTRTVGLLLFCLVPPCEAAQTLVLNSSFYAPITSPDKTGVLDLLYKELSRRLGIEIVIQSLPAERALINANHGIEDGDVCRIAGLDEKYPNLIRVPEAVMSYQMSVFSRNANFKVSGPQSLKPYDVGIITGWKILERNTSEARSVIRVENGEQLFTMLDKGRIDAVVIENIQGVMLIKKMGLRQIRLLQPPFIKGEWYLYLNRMHKSLVPVISAELKAMKRDGTHRRIFDSVLERYVP